MYTTRQNKTARLIQKELAGIFLKEAGSMFPDTMITVTIVRMSPDLLVAKVYLSLFTTGNKQKALDTVRDSRSQLRRWLGHRIGKQVRRIPELIFYEDDSLDHIERIDQLLKD
ncbi:MAG: 30S ribosome-binding factor RbfA [Bacteroidetes bacterium]|nr:30S ribosome-binding factor RbfA [Bacteroidota bacterium]